jgi:transposase
MSETDLEGKRLQRRRLRAGRLLLLGMAQAEVARRVGVTRATVSEWSEKLNRGGLGALKRRPRGRPAELDPTQRRELIKQLRRGALDAGFARAQWTLPRVGQLIEQRFARRYSGSQVWRILVSLGFSYRRLSGWTLERDGSAIQRWQRPLGAALTANPSLDNRLTQPAAGAEYAMHLLHADAARAHRRDAFAAAAADAAERDPLRDTGLEELGAARAGP